MIEVYAITDHPGPPLPRVADLHAVATGRLAAIWGPARDGDVTGEALWRHEAVVEALMADRDLLPVRYGTRLDDEAAVARTVAERCDDLAAALDRVRGAVELSLRVLAAGERTDPAAPHAGGAEYLRAKARSAGARAGVVRSVHEPLTVFARASVQRAPQGPFELLRAAYLIDRGVVAAFARHVARLQDRAPELRLLCTGPWPPYSFAER